MVDAQLRQPGAGSGRAGDRFHDVFGLGALLFTLLTGSSPHRFRDGSPQELLWVVCEEPVLPPSRAVLDGEITAPVRPWQLAGDLDTIVSKALSKNPAARYASVADLAADVRRHMEGRPILARPPTLGYRFGRFLRRNWQLASAATLLLLVLAGSVVVLSHQVQVISRERTTAELERARAEEVSRLFVEIFEQADPNRSRGEEPHGAGGPGPRPGAASQGVGS